MSEERGVANILGYVILFSIVLLSITLAATFGVGGISDARDGTIRLNAQQSMQTVGVAAADLRESNTTLRRTTFRTSSGTLGYGEPTTVTISVGGTERLLTTFRPIQYRFEGTAITYEGGAVIESHDGTGTGVTVAEPPFVFDSEAVILPIVTTDPAAMREVSGGIVTTRLRREHSKLAHDGTGPQTVGVEIDTTPGRATAWNEALGAAGATCSDTGTPETVSCDYTPAAADASIIVREFRLSYEYQT